MSAPVDVDDIELPPWQRYDWKGSLVSVDDCDASDFGKEDVARVVAFGTTEVRDWDGDSAGIVELKDGRFAAWECNWGPTGNGFCCDAYGGEADIYLAHTVEAAALRISEKARELLVYQEAE